MKCFLNNNKLPLLKLIETFLLTETFKAPSLTPNSNVSPLSLYFNPLVKIFFATGIARIETDSAAG